MDSNKKNLNFFKKTAEKASVKNRLISYSLMWMGLGVAIIFLMTYLFMSVNQIADAFLRIQRTFYPILVVLNIGLILVISFLIQRFSLSTLTLLYIGFVLIQGIFIPTTLFYSGFGIDAQGLKNVFLLFLIPSVIFVMMGLLGYFQLFDFSKIAPFLFFSTIGLLIFSVFLIFWGGETAQKWYSLIGVIVFSLWIGFDIWWIQRTSEQLEGQDIPREEMIKLGLMFGIRLFIDFINILMFVARSIR